MTFRCLLMLAILPFTVLANDAWTPAKAVLTEHCTKCHGGVKHKGGLDLRAVPNILRGGESGPAVVVGEPAASLLMEVLHPEAETSMPPKGEPLKAAEVDVIASWIRSLADQPPAPSAETMLPEGMEPPLVIDFLVARGWKEREVRASSRVNDEGFVRRAYLDLIGRIPTTGERADFLAETASGKRELLVNSLLERPEFVRHFAEIFDTVLMGRRHGLVGNTRALERGGDWHAYLQWVFQTNRPWNVVAHDLLESRGDEGETRGARWYLVGHKDQHEDIVRTVAPTLLGKQIACAQCHNHPLIPEIEQHHYWGLVAFFKRSFTVETPHGLALGEAASGGEFEFSSLEGKSFSAALAFLSGQTIEETGAEVHDASLYRVPPSEEYFERISKKAEGANDEDKSKKRHKETLKMEAAPVPALSRREALAEIAIEAYPDFAKSFVNRMWALLLGRGIVHPVDHLDSIHPPSHPELLEWLGKDFAANGYDIKRLLRSIMASQAYQLAALPQDDHRPRDEAFACGPIKPLSAEALYRSMLVAGGHQPDANGLFSSIDEERYRHAFAKVYGDVFPETFSPVAAEGMFFTNNPLMSEILVRSFEGQSTGQIVESAFTVALGRSPDPGERAAGTSFLGETPVPSKATALLWALIAGSEFRFNH